MKIKLAILSLISCCYLYSHVQVQARDDVIYMQLGVNALPMHMKAGELNKKIPTYVAFEDYWYFVEDICTSINVKCDFYIRDAKIKNASALIYKDNTGDTKVVVYDRTLGAEVGLVGAVALLAHEIGHHVCGHTKGLSKSAWQPRSINWKREYEADIVMGAALRKQNLVDGFSELQATLTKVFAKKSTPTHPPLDKRLDAIKKGWRNPKLARTCGR